MLGRVSPKSRGRKVKTGRRGQRRAPRVRAGTDRAVGLERVLVDALPRAAIAPDRFGKACRRPIERVDGLAEQGDGSRREASEPDAAV
jgi:hypothetical protein